jgi:hypothetical protein
MADLGRDDTRFVRDELGIPYLSLVAACDAVFTKPGYGIVAEATAQRTRILYTDRSDFPEYPHLVRWLDDNGTAAHVAAADLGTERGAAAIGRSLDALFAMPARWPDAIGGGERVADAILSLVVT